jgi:hypothetical protein
VTEMTTIGALAKYFNEGDGKRSLTKFSEEVKALSMKEKRELAEGACKVMGWTLKK